MAAFPTYHLAFRSPLHVGERGVGLETAQIHVPADTLFSAICSVWRAVYGVDGLLGDVLDWFDETGSEPFFSHLGLSLCRPGAVLSRSRWRVCHT